MDADIAFAGSDDEHVTVDVHKHKKLVADVQGLEGDAKSKYKFQRGEAAPRLSEFGLPSSAGQLSLEELVGDSSKLGLKKVLKRIVKKKNAPSSVLDPVLLKPEEEKQNRVVAYSKVRDDLRKWDEVVWENRVAPNLHFPLEKPTLRVQSLKEYAEDFTPATPLEDEVMALLNGGKDSLNQFKVAKSRSEEVQLRKRALEEIRERRAELIKQRMKVAYEARKAKHRNRIKSRRFHQVLRREKFAIEKKAQENATPEEAAEMIGEKLAELERVRIEERASLRHRSGSSKYADKQKIMARFNPEARQAVEDMAAMSKRLTEKRNQLEENDDKDSSDDDQSSQASDAGGNDNSTIHVSKDSSGKKNPWFFASSNGDDIKNINSKAKSSDATEESKGAHYTKLKKISAAENAIRRDDAEFYSGQAVDDLAKDLSDSDDQVVSKRPSTIQEAIGATETRVQPILAPSLIAEAPHNPNDQRLDVAAAFAEDDVVAEFVSEKEKLANKEQPRDIDLSLPGWGGWAGPGIKPSNRKRKGKNFVLKAEKVERRDAKIPHVIIKEGPKAAVEAISKHQPTSVPFPFTSARAYERSMRQPIGREWVPEFARRDLIKPRIETQIGAVIEPLDSDGKVLKKKLEEIERTFASKKAAAKDAKKKPSLRAQLKKSSVQKKKTNK